MSLRGSPVTLRKPTAPFSVRMMEWSTRVYTPGTSGVNSTIVAPPAGTRVVCSDLAGGLCTSPSR